MIDYVIKDDTGFYGHVFTDGDNPYYIKVSMALAGDVYVIVETKVDSFGMWAINMYCNPNKVVISVVDKPNAFGKFEYNTYDLLELEY